MGFQVKLSTEGFPQAVQVQKICRLQGVVKHVPSSESDGIVIVTGDASDGAKGTLNSKDLRGAEVRLRQCECGLAACA